MADNISDLNHPILNLNSEEKRAYSYLFKQADTEQLGVVTGERAVAFFERTNVDASVLGQIWQLADTENRGLLTKPGFCMVLRLIGHYQAGREPSSELAFRPAPIPRFIGLQIPGAGAPASPKLGSPTISQFPPNALQPQLSGQSGPIRLPPLDPQKIQQYSGLFERSGSQDGLLDGAAAKTIFERAGLPNGILGRIWALADRDQRGSLNQTEFIVAMHLLTSLKIGALTSLPAALPQALYDAAGRWGATVPSTARQSQSTMPRQPLSQAAIAQPRLQSPVGRQGFSSPIQTLVAAQPAVPWLVSLQEKSKYDQYFATVDTSGQGFVTGEQAVRFFSESGLSEEILAQIWDLADIDNEGHLSRDEFAVAMYLIRQQRGPNSSPLPAFLPPMLIPPSMRQKPQQAQSIVEPHLSYHSDTPVTKSSAAEDLFGLDSTSLSSPVVAKQQGALQPQISGLQASRDPFSSSSADSTNGAQRLPTQPQPVSATFKPFLPTSAFGVSLAHQNTGGSIGSMQSQTKMAPQAPISQRSAVSEDLLGDDEAGLAENGRITQESTELGNMSSQIGNLRLQMEQTQAKKSVAQEELSLTSVKKRDLELRLQQFRVQYEQEVQVVKEVEQQLASVRESSARLAQDLALVEGAHQDLQTRRKALSQQLHADLQENASLKQSISQINGLIAQIRPEIEKLKSDARQQKGLVSINKKQLATNEHEHVRLSAEKADLEHAAQDASRNMQTQSEGTTKSPAAFESSSDIIASPSGSVISSTNPFFRRTTAENALDQADGPVNSSTPKSSVFDAIFGTSSGLNSGSDTEEMGASSHKTGMVGRSHAPIEQPAPHAQSLNSSPTQSRTTPSATPPPESLSRQGSAFVEESTGSDRSHASNIDTSASTLPKIAETLPGSFPQDDSSELTLSNHKDFVDAFADFSSDQATDGQNHSQLQSGLTSNGARDGASARMQAEFPPIRNVESEEDESDDSDEDHLSSSRSHGKSPASKAAAPIAPPSITSQTSPPPYERADEVIDASTHTGSTGFPPEFGGLLPSREASASIQGSSDLHNGGSHANGESAAAVLGPTDGSKAPEASKPAVTQTSLVGHISPDQHLPLVENNTLATASLPSTDTVKEAYDEFDGFDNLADAREGGIDSAFGFGANAVDEFNPAFDSAVASIDKSTSLQPTSVTSPDVQQAKNSLNGNAESPPLNKIQFSALADARWSSAKQTRDHAQHDWDAIFSGLDNSKSINTTLAEGDDPWSTSRHAVDPTLHATSNAPRQPAPGPAQYGSAITPGTEHDDPILKRLTNMGYQRTDALNALEKFDYDINKAVDHLSN